MFSGLMYKNAVRQWVAEAPGVSMALHADHSTPHTDFGRLCTASISLDMQWAKTMPGAMRYTPADGSMRLEDKFGIRRTDMAAPRLLDMERMWLRDLVTSSLVADGHIQLPEKRHGYYYQADPTALDECFQHTDRQVLDYIVMRTDMVMANFLKVFLQIETDKLFKDALPRPAADDGDGNGDENDDANDAPNTATVHDNDNTGAVETLLEGYEQGGGARIALQQDLEELSNIAAPDAASVATPAHEEAMPAANPVNVPVLSTAGLDH